MFNMYWFWLIQASINMDIHVVIQDSNPFDCIIANLKMGMSPSALMRSTLIFNNRRLESSCLCFVVFCFSIIWLFMWDKRSACTSFVLSIFDFKDDNKNWSLQDTSPLHLMLRISQQQQKDHPYKIPHLKYVQRFFPLLPFW